jgi:hypothetical protein
VILKKQPGFRSIPVAFHGGTVNPSYARLVLRESIKPFNAGRVCRIVIVQYLLSTVVRGTKNPSVAREKRARMMHRSRGEDCPLEEKIKDEQEMYAQTGRTLLNLN